MLHRMDDRDTFDCLLALLLRGISCQVTLSFPCLFLSE
jgi:hypothetical protein